MADQDPRVPAGMSPERAESVREFVDKLSSDLPHLQLDDGSQKEMESHISKLESLLSSDDAEHTVIDDALEAMHRLLESSTTQKATQLLQEAGRFLTGLG